MNQELQSVQLNQQLLEERQEEINKLAMGVEEISELFQDISILVSQQGDQIDNIEANIINSLTHIDKANVKLKKAEKYQSRFGNSCFYCISIITLIIIIIIIIVIIIFVIKN